ncbi:MAG: hypothetical protein DMD89_34520 [Candidatus Rokuibacteriota bacterium]|nr:MAG: hypothetical protein DMD89_34520 [Candidatus Rokubacteria bacterium]
MAARYYSPTWQRFISEDPLGFAAGRLNLYPYANENPLSFTDPLGLETFGVGGHQGTWTWVWCIFNCDKNGGRRNAAPPPPPPLSKRKWGWYL